MNKILLQSAVVALLTGLACGDVVTQRWGVSGKVQHPNTLKFESKAGQTVMAFDLSALPKDAAIYRARLVLVREGSDYLTSFDLRTNDEAAKPVELAAPLYRWFEATDLVKAWAKAGGGSIAIRSAPKFVRDASFLEVTYEGKLAEPPQQVAGVSAFYRAGQVFLTWKEIEDVTEGQAQPHWAQLMPKIKGISGEGVIPKDDPRELRYRIYRHDQPITPANLGQARLIAEVASGSAIDTRACESLPAKEPASMNEKYVSLPWHIQEAGGKIKDTLVALRHAIEPGKPLEAGVGLYVHTVAGEGKGYYAVVTTVNGLENTTAISSANAIGPVDEKPADAEPVMQHELTFYPKTREFTLSRRYVYWAAPPLAIRPMPFGLIVQWHPDGIAKPAAPLDVNHGTAHYIEPMLGRWVRPDAILMAVSDDAGGSMWSGVNDCLGTLKSYRQGKFQGFVYRRQAKLVEWAKQAFPVDEQQVYAYCSHWGLSELRHPEVYATVITWGAGDPFTGFVDINRARSYWGPPETYDGRSDTENPYKYCDYSEFVRSDPARTLPYQFLMPCQGSHTSEMSWCSVPKYMRAAVDARQSFSCGIGKVSQGPVAPLTLREFHAGKLNIRRDQSKPAFTNCSIDDNPGNGDISKGDRVGVLNGYLFWDTNNILDEPGKWALTVWLDNSAPLPTCTVDLTPRNCQKFFEKPAAGGKFKWTAAPEPVKAETQPSGAEKQNPGKLAQAAGAAIPAQSGQAQADKYGLVTIPQLTVGKEKLRVVIERE